MIDRLTQKYRIVCDRCGKEHIREEGVMDDAVFHHVTIGDQVKHIVSVELCSACYDELCEYMENFFDEVNKHDNI
jgi:NMD protein affecting ribosome stability and mRNA decay